MGIINMNHQTCEWIYHEYLKQHELIPWISWISVFDVYSKCIWIGVIVFIIGIIGVIMIDEYTMNVW